MSNFAPLVILGVCVATKFKNTGKVENHPDRDLIISWISNGLTAVQISEKLKIKYPRVNQDDMRVSQGTIKVFKKEYMNIDKHAAEDIKNFKLWNKEKELEEEIKSSDAYTHALKKAVDSEIDARKEISDILFLIKERLKVFYNTLAGKDKLDERNERILQSYMTQCMDVVEKNEKYVNGYKETTQHNVNVNIMSDQVILIRDAMRETLSDIDPSLAIEFMERLNLKMKELRYTLQSPKDVQMYERALIGSSDEEN